MALRWLVRPNAYHDSVKLMRVSEALASLPGVVRAAVVMATPLNVELLVADGLLPGDERPAADDLLAAVLGTDEDAANAALAQLDTLLTPTRTEERATEVPIRLIESAGERGANLAVIAVPGPSAAVEAYSALRAGMHVFLFSDNVAVEDEIRLKRLAAERDLLLMGPDCGTAIIEGVGLGFANRVERGPVGIAGASGTGIQQVCCLLDAAGVGIAAAIGTGGRDLSSQVGGLMTRRALRLLAEDDRVQVITVISKPPDMHVAEDLHREMCELGKSVIACLPGSCGEDQGALRYASTLTEAARLVCEELGMNPPIWDTVPAERRRPGFHSRVYGLFTGGTLASEAERVLDTMGVPHALVDLGDDQYTRGRAHPMIDPRLRTSTLGDVGRHGDAGAVLVDVVLGDLAHPDPAGALIPGLEALRAGNRIPVFAVLVGARRDPQGLEGQRRILQDAGVQVFAGTAAAATAAGLAVGGDPA